MKRFELFCWSVAMSALALMFPGPVDADIVIDNFAEAGPTGYGLSDPFFGSNVWAQRFSTGSNGYQLDKVSVRVLNASSPAITAKLWVDNGGLPQTNLATFTLANSPASGVYDTYEFTTSSTLNLQGSTDYYFSVESAGGSAFLLASVFGSNNYVGPGTLYSQLATSSDGGVSWSGGGSNHMVIRVEGTPLAFATPEPSTWLSGLLVLTGMSLVRRRR